MSDLDILALLLILLAAFIAWCACLLAVSRLAARAVRVTGQRAAGWVLYALTECGPIDADPELYAARAAAVDHHRITIQRGIR